LPSAPNNTLRLNKSKWYRLHSEPNQQAARPRTIRRMGQLVNPLFAKTQQPSIRFADITTLFDTWLSCA
jgi:hypothetical protein